MKTFSKLLLFITCGLLLAALVPTKSQAGLVCNTFTGTILEKKEAICDGTCTRHRDLIDPDSNDFLYHYRTYIRIENSFQEDSKWYEIDWYAYIKSGRIGATARFYTYFGGFIYAAEVIKKP